MDGYQTLLHAWLPNSLAQQLDVLGLFRCFMARLLTTLRDCSPTPSSADSTWRPVLRS